MNEEVWTQKIKFKNREEEKKYWQAEYTMPCILYSCSGTMHRYYPDDLFPQFAGMMECDKCRTQTKFYDSCDGWAEFEVLPENCFPPHPNLPQRSRYSPTKIKFVNAKIINFALIDRIQRDMNGNIMSFFVAVAMTNIAKKILKGE